MADSQKFTVKDLDRLALLSRVTLSLPEKKLFLSQITSILEYVNRLQTVDTKGVKPTSQVTEAKNVYRPDEVTSCLSQKAALAPTARIQDGYFVVPSTIKK